MAPKASKYFVDWKKSVGAYVRTLDRLKQEPPKVLVGNEPGKIVFVPRKKA